jgi:NAD(P)-dependent dehydrogenase (short-subunit alcohol dehydrogenase family)
MSNRLKDKVAIITGAAKGIGFATAQRFAQEGAKEMIADLNPDAVKTAAEQIPGAEAHIMNVTDRASIQAVVDQIIQQHGRIDILVNNAAANPYYGPTVDCPDSAYDKIMDINVKAPFQLCKMVHPVMKMRGGGSIINISSIAGETPDPGLGIYSVSKAAINMLTKVFAKEWGEDGIRVNAIAPGLIKTKFSQALWKDEKTLAHFTKRLPIARMGTVEEVASLVLYLASDASGYCTGGIYTVDGGTTI